MMASLMQQQHMKMMMLRESEGKPSEKQLTYYPAPYHAGAAPNKPPTSSTTGSASLPPASTAPSATAGSHVKSEPNFSLYGYQPFPHMYISQEKLYQHGLKEDKGSVPKSEHHDVKHSLHSSQALAASPTGAGKKGGFASPPPLIRSEVKAELHGKPSSVIVENKAIEARDLRDSAYHHPGGSITLGTASAQHSRGQPIKQEGHMPSSASPLCVASPRHLSQAVMQPMDLQKRSSGGPAYPPSGHRSGERDGEPQRSSGKSQPGPAIAQPPVSLPGTTASSHSFNLIQQGLVPNPIYTQTSQVNTKVASSESQQSSAATAALLGQPHQAGQKSSHPLLSPSSSHQHSYKRRSDKEASSSSNRKKPKTEGSHATPSPGPAGGQTAAPQAPTGNATSTSVTYMDSFRSFVENAVQSAFYQDQELGVNKDGKNKPRPGTTTTTTVTKTQPTAQASQSSVTLPSSSAHFHSQPAATAVSTTNTTATTTTTTTPFSPFPSLSSSVTRPGPASTPGGASVSSTSSIMETINRVANGFVDTDSDTLSAPSPTPDIKAGENNNPSPLKLSGSATKFKKAWLQRYSDEDKKNADSTENKPGESKNEKGDPVKDCYVNCSYISPTDGGGKSPISMLKDLTSRKDEDSTSSASEIESPGNDTVKRRKKPTRRSSTGSSSSKKIKLSGDESTTSTATAGSSNKKRSRKGKTEKSEKREKTPDNDNEDMEKEEVKKEKAKPKEAPPKEKKYVPKSDCETKLEKKRKTMSEKGITTRGQYICYLT